MTPPVISKAKALIFAGPAGPVLKGMAKLTMGAAASRAIALLAIPVISRLYSPDEYGVLSIFNSIVLLCVPIMTLRYVVAVPLPKSNAIAFNILALSTVLVVGFSMALAILLWRWEGLFSALEMEMLHPWWGLMVAAAAGSAIYEILTAWATRQRDYNSIARSQIAQTSIGEGMKIALGAFHFGALGLLFGQVLVQGAGALALTSRYWRTLTLQLQQLRRRRLAATALRYANLPVYRLPAQILLSAAMQAPMIGTALLYTGDDVGHMGLAMLAIALPFTLLGQSMGRALLGETAQIAKESPTHVRTVVMSAAIRLAILYLPISVTLLLAGEWLFGLIFGDAWRPAGRLASFFAVFLFFQGMSSPLLEVYSAFDRHSAYFWIYLQRFALCLAALVAAWLADLPFMAFGFVYGVCMAAHYALATAYIYVFLQHVSNTRT